MPKKQSVANQTKKGKIATTIYIPPRTPGREKSRATTPPSPRTYYTTAPFSVLRPPRANPPTDAGRRRAPSSSRCTGSFPLRLPPRSAGWTGYLNTDAGSAFRSPSAKCSLYSDAYRPDWDFIPVSPFLSSPLGRTRRGGRTGKENGEGDVTTCHRCPRSPVLCWRLGGSMELL